MEQNSLEDNRPSARQKFPAFNGTHNFISVFITGRQVLSVLLSSTFLEYSSTYVYSAQSISYRPLNPKSNTRVSPPPYLPHALSISLFLDSINRTKLEGHKFCPES